MAVRQVFPGAKQPILKGGADLSSGNRRRSQRKKKGAGQGEPESGWTGNSSKGHGLVGGGGVGKLEGTRKTGKNRCGGWRRFKKYHKSRVKASTQCLCFKSRTGSHNGAKELRPGSGRARRKKKIRNVGVKTRAVIVGRAFGSK